MPRNFYSATPRKVIKERRTFWISFSQEARTLSSRGYVLRISWGSRFRLTEFATQRTRVPSLAPQARLPQVLGFGMSGCGASPRQPENCTYQSPEQVADPDLL